MERISHPMIEKWEANDLYHEKNITRQKAKVFRMFGGKEYTVRLQFHNELPMLSLTSSARM